MTDKYQALRDALAAGPTPGPWIANDTQYSDTVVIVNAEGFEVVEVPDIQILLGHKEKLGISHWSESERASRDVPEIEQAATARYVAAANPSAISALLAERDALREALRDLYDALDSCVALTPEVMLKAREQGE